MEEKENNGNKRDKRAFKIEIGPNLGWAVFWVGVFILIYFNKC